MIHSNFGIISHEKIKIPFSEWLTICKPLYPVRRTVHLDSKAQSEFPVLLHFKTEITRNTRAINIVFTFIVAVGCVHCIHFRERIRGSGTRDESARCLVKIIANASDTHMLGTWLIRVFYLPKFIFIAIRTRVIRRRLAVRSAPTAGKYFSGKNPLRR